MKGLELPINIIIVIAIAVLVLVVISAFFAGQFGGGVNTIQLETAFSSACSTWRSAYNCDINSVSQVVSNFKFPGQPTNADLRQLCAYKTVGSGTGEPDLTACQRACGCAI